ncbi:MAG: hypothetical protein ABFR97_06170 [Thermodesulfobacteriota bacterium]
MRAKANFGLLLVLFTWLLGPALVRADGGSDAAQANNPLANMKAFNLQDYYIGEFTEGDEDANQFWLRYAQPIAIGNSSWLMRASLPINTFPSPPNGGSETGIGDFNVFAAYLFDTGNPAISFGVGPQLTLPSATEDSLGSEKVSAGLANVLFNAESPMLQYGYLLTWQHSIAGPSDRADVNVAALQPFGMLQLGKGWYLRSTAIWVYDLESDDYSVPVGLGVGKVIMAEKMVYNIFVEPQYSVVDEGGSLPQWQILFGFNMQFK